MNFIIFDDENVHNFYPISQTKPLWEIISGIFSFRERFEFLIQKKFKKSKIYYFTKDYLKSYYNEKYPDMSINNLDCFKDGKELFFVSGTVYANDSLLMLDSDSILLKNGIPIAARISDYKSDLSQSIKIILNDYNFKKRIEISENVDKFNIEKAEYIWDIVSKNYNFICEDFKLLSQNNKKNFNKDVTIIGDRDQLFIEEDVRIDPFVVFDVSKGPIYIKSGTEIHSFTRIEGPSCIGKNTMILGAKIRHGTTIGECCRIGGEVEASIFHGFSNKYHDGFIGHSYIGEWINLGALTTNSDLKNNYSSIKVYTPTGRMNTDSNKIGCFMGDFVKTSIGTIINTGSSIGTGAMLIHDGKLTPGHIPPFAWFFNSSISNLSWFNDFIESAKEMIGRRNITFTEKYENLLRTLYESKDEYYSKFRKG